MRKKRTYGSLLNVQKYFWPSGQKRGMPTSSQGDGKSHQPGIPCQRYSSQSQGPSHLNCEQLLTCMSEIKIPGNLPQRCQTWKACWGTQQASHSAQLWTWRMPMSRYGSFLSRSAVTTPDSNMVSQVVQIGDCNAPATYQALMYYLFQPMSGASWILLSIQIPWWII